MDDYKEKYDKLVKAIEVLQNTNQSDEAIQTWVNENVPELRESEDEKIRKRIIQAIKIREKEMNEEWSNEIAWIEKQEQQFSWSYEDEANLNNIIWLCNNCINGSETTWVPSQAAKIKHLIETIKEKGHNLSMNLLSITQDRMYYTIFYNDVFDGRGNGNL